MISAAWSSPYVVSGPELRLGNAAQLELLRTVLGRGASMRMRVRGSSMSPFVRDGDLVTIVPAAGRQFRVGDVVAAVAPANARLVVHRLVARRGNRWLLRGDNCREADGVIAVDAVVGVVARVRRGQREHRLGVAGSSTAWVAAANRNGRLAAALASWTLLRRSVARFNPWRQSTPSFPSVMRALASAPPVSPASPGESEAALRRLTPRATRAARPRSES
jgi:hypothetical protein